MICHNLVFSDLTTDVSSDVEVILQEHCSQGGRSYYESTDETKALERSRLVDEKFRQEMGQDDEESADAQFVDLLLVNVVGCVDSDAASGKVPYGEQTR